MAAITTDLIGASDAPLPSTVLRKRALQSPIRSASATAAVLYSYREANGTRGSTTSVVSIPAGAVVLRAVTS